MNEVHPKGRQQDVVGQLTKQSSFFFNTDWIASLRSR